MMQGVPSSSVLSFRFFSSLPKLMGDETSISVDGSGTGESTRLRLFFLPPPVQIIGNCGSVDVELSFAFPPPLLRGQASSLLISVTELY